MSWFTLVKKAASLIPAAPAGKGRLFLDDAGAVAVKNAAGALLTLQAIPKGFIEGLRMEWVSGTQIRVSTGAAYVPGVGRVVELAAPVTLTPTLSASTWYHVYLVGGTVTAEADTTAPAAPYYGTARTKTGDTSRRYIGSFRTDAAGAIYNFLIQASQQVYMQEVPRSISGGGTTSFTLASLSALMPMTSRAALASMTNTGSAAVRFRPAGSTFTGMNRMYGLTPGAYVVGILPTDSAQNIEFQSEVGGSGALDVVGFVVER